MESKTQTCCFSQHIRCIFLCDVYIRRCSLWIVNALDMIRRWWVCSEIQRYLLYARGGGGFCGLAGSAIMASNNLVVYQNFQNFTWIGTSFPLGFDFEVGCVICL